MLQFKHERKQWFIFNSPLEISYASALILVKGKVWRHFFFSSSHGKNKTETDLIPLRRDVCRPKPDVSYVSVTWTSISVQTPNQTKIPSTNQIVALGDIQHTPCCCCKCKDNWKSSPTSQLQQHPSAVVNNWCSYVWQDLLFRVFYNEQLEMQECSLNVQTRLVSKDVNIYRGFGLSILAQGSSQTCYPLSHPISCHLSGLS